MNWQEEVKSHNRFNFGSNWNNFLNSLNTARINEAESSIKELLGIESLYEKSFIDVGCGSGIFSLAAKRLGAKVYSFDYDENSVNCTQALKNKFFPDDQNWLISSGSILDENYLNKLEKYDIVYSWGVLHHTGNMQQALLNVIPLIKSGGNLVIAIYNDQGLKSVLWSKIKRIYCSGLIGSALVKIIFIPYFFLTTITVGLIKYKNLFARFNQYKKKRGMHIFNDWIDWLGGYPFEVAKPEDIIDLYLKEEFDLKKLITTNRSGCNQYVFQKK